MDSIKLTINEQMQQLQMQMHRASFTGYMNGNRMQNLYADQGRVLALLKIKPEASRKELAYLLGIGEQAIIELLGGLECNGYILHEQLPGENSMTVKLTETGLEAANNVDDHASRTFNVFDCFTGEELAAFSDYLSRIINQYEVLYREEYEDYREAAIKQFRLLK